MAEVNPKAKGFSSLIIVILFVVLIGGGFGLWMFLKPKSSDDNANESTNTEDDPLTGRNDASGQNTGLTAEQIANLFGNQDNSFGSTQGGGGSGDNENTNPPPPPLYVKSNKAKELIAAKAERLQSKGQVMDIIRAKYDIGKSLIAFGQDAQRAIDSLMSKVAGVDLSTNPTKRYLTYPIYGTHESRGAQARQQLQNLINRDAHGFSLANGRHSDSPWWIPALQINLLIGTDKADTWSADQIWWGVQGIRQDVDWFKAMNGLWKSDHQLLEPSSGTPWYYAGNMRTFVRRWIEAIDRLDLVTEWEAIRTLTAPVSQGGDGWVFTYIDPNTGEDHSGQYDPQDSTTNDNVDAILN